MDEVHVGEGYYFSKETLLQKLSRRMAQAEDEVLKTVISEAMGRTDWTPEEVAHRGQWERCEHDPKRGKVFLFDNVALVQFLPIEYTQVGGELNGEFKYKIY